MPEIGQIISHYKILEKIGEGGMGTVFLAEDLTLDRKVALKFLPEAFTDDPERMARFEREAKLLASLSHPNIAGIYGLELAEWRHPCHIRPQQDNCVGLWRWRVHCYQ